MPRKKGATESFMSPDARRVRVPEAIVKKKAAIYVRVSTRYQVDKDSLPFQKEELVNYIKYALNIEDYVIFEDAGYSAKNTSRPKFQEMMTRIRNNEFTHLVVYKIDRISRNLLDFAQMYEELQKHRCSFVSKVEQFDTSTAMGEAMTRIVLMFAELERKMTGERVTAIRWRAPIIFDLLSGLRRAELLGLRWQDVNLDDGVIRIVQTSNYVSGKGVYVDTPKTEDSDRYLKVSRTAILILLEYKNWQDEMREKVGDAWQGSPEDDRVFTNDVGRPWFPTSLTQWMGKFIKRTGLPSSCVHSLRHPNVKPKTQIFL